MDEFVHVLEECNNKCYVLIDYDSNSMVSLIIL